MKKGALKKTGGQTNLLWESERQLTEHLDVSQVGLHCQQGGNHKPGGRLQEGAQGK